MELSYRFFHEVMYPLLKAEYPILLDKCAFGLIGEGSECYGYDDEFSKDHDFSPLCCIFVPHICYQDYYPLINEMLKKLPDNYDGYQLGLDNPVIASRRGPIDIADFFMRYLNSETVPDDLLKWNDIPSHHLSTAVNGVIFMDNEGTFSKIREILLKGYPEAVKLHKMAYSCAMIAQSGQYNYGRCLKRADLIGADIAKAHFFEHAMQLVYLLNDKYAPYYKWMHQGLLNCEFGGNEVYYLLESMTISCTNEKIDRLCDTLYKLLNHRYPMPLESGFFLDYARSLKEIIKEPAIKELSIWKP